MAHRNKLTALVKQELQRAKKKKEEAMMSLLKEKCRATNISLSESDDPMPGVGLAHAALKIAMLRAKFDAASENVALLEYLLREGGKGSSKINKDCIPMEGSV